MFNRMNNLTKFNLNEISEKITKPWSPENIETVNDYVVRMARYHETTTSKPH